MKATGSPSLIGVGHSIHCVSKNDALKCRVSEGWIRYRDMGVDAVPPKVFMLCLRGRSAMGHVESVAGRGIKKPSFSSEDGGFFHLQS